MSGSSVGKIFKVTTWGESHGKNIGAVVDGCPAGLRLCEDDVQIDLDRRKPAQSQMTTSRKESDRVQIVSGVFNGVTTGSPIALVIENCNARPNDYESLKDVYRPAHADFTYEAKYGHRDFRGGGRSSGRETAARVAAGAVARKLLSEFGIEISAYTYSIGNVTIDKKQFDIDEAKHNALYMPDKNAALQAEQLVKKLFSEGDSVGGIIECVAFGVYAGLGEPVFEKLDAMIAQAVFSIGGVKGVEFGLGFGAASCCASFNNDEFYFDNGVKKRTNNCGGVLGGISDGSDIVFRVAVKPTPSIRKVQKTINSSNEEVEISIHGRHDPVIVPRAVVVVEAMTAITLADYALQNVCANIKNIKE